MIKTDTKTFGDMRFVTTQFPAMRGMAVLARLLKLVGPAIGGLHGISLETNLDSIMPAIGQALTDIDPDALTRLASDLLRDTHVMLPGADRRLELTGQDAIDAVFSGRLRIFFDVLVWVVKWNFQDFTTGGVLPSAPGAAASAVLSPTS